MAPTARQFVVGEIGMDGLRDVAKQLACGVGRVARRRLRCRARRGLRRLRVLVRRGIGDLASRGLVDGALELVELLVQQAHLLAVPDPERGQLRRHTLHLRGALAERRVELGEPRVQALDLLLLRLSGSDKAGHRSMISR